MVIEKGKVISEGELTARVTEVVKGALLSDVLKDAEDYKKYNAITGTTLDEEAYNKLLEEAPNYLYQLIPEGLKTYPADSEDSDSSDDSSSSSSSSSSDSGSGEGDSSGSGDEGSGSGSGSGDVEEGSGSGSGSGDVEEGSGSGSGDTNSEVEPVVQP